MEGLGEKATPWRCRARVAWAPSPHPLPPACPAAPQPYLKPWGRRTCSHWPRPHTGPRGGAPVGGAVVIVHLAELPTVARETFAPATRQSVAASGRPASRQPLLNLHLSSRPLSPLDSQSLAHSLRSVSAWFTWGTVETSFMKTVVDPSQNLSGAG